MQANKCEAIDGVGMELVLARIQGKGPFNLVR